MIRDKISFEEYTMDEEVEVGELIGVTYHVSENTLMYLLYLVLTNGGEITSVEGLNIKFC